uniref:RNase H type-1 domain-containing protein n=1 Tax=Kalanchoe fedtschenkoi TaxID=63787 RepID=A0A7N0UKL9_KALFE
MSCLFRASSAIFSRTAQSVSKTTLHSCCCSFSPWKRSFINAGVRTTDESEFVWRFRVQCYSSRKKKSGSTKSGSKALMGDEKHAFFVVRKGDLIGFYNSLSDCQAQVGSSICDPPVSVYKGYSMRKETEEYLVSRGLKGAAYTIKAADLKDDLFGTLFPCPVEISVIADPSLLPQKKSMEELGTNTGDEILNQGAFIETRLLLTGHKSCVLEFDGASKGNPGKAGAGAVLRADDGKVICRLREGLGTATNNVAEYRAMILGLKHALKSGYTHIRVQGDSKLVCLQIQDKWKTKHEKMAELCKEAKKLKTKFTAFQINHVLRGLNSEADAEANLAVQLADGQVEEVYDN